MICVQCFRDNSGPEMKPYKMDGYMRCPVCGFVAHDLVHRVNAPTTDDNADQELREGAQPTFSQRMQGEIMKIAAAPLLNALTAIAQISVALARIATALEDRPARSPLDALRAAHPDLTWTTYERGCLGTAYDGRNGHGLHVIARRDGEVWTAARWVGVELVADATAPTPDGVVALLLGTATVHTFAYHNHMGEMRTARILDGTQSVTLEPTMHYPHDGPKVRAWDVDRADWRVYDMARIEKP